MPALAACSGRAKTVLGAWKSGTGRAELDELFAALEQTFSGCASYRFEVVAAEVSGDTAYTVGYEHTQAVIDGEARTYTLRVTQIYRREGGGGRWFIGTAARCRDDASIN